MAKKDIILFHGDVIGKEYPEHLDWFIPDLTKSLTKLLADFNIKILTIEVNFRSILIELNIIFFDKIIEKTINFNNINSSEKLIGTIIDSINDSIIDDLKGMIIVAYRAMNNSNLNLCLASNLELNTLKSFPNIINNPLKYKLSDKRINYEGVKEFGELDLRNISEQYAGDFPLPLFPNENSKQQTVKIFESIANLNPNNRVSFRIDQIISTNGAEKAEVAFLFEGHEQKIIFTWKDFDRIGLELNKLLENIEGRYVLLEPNPDNIIYAFCSSIEIEQLKKYGFIRDQYLNK